MRIIGSDRFKLVYWIIALATAQHTAWGAATTMQGVQPSDPAIALGWWVQGLAFAIAIDFTMVMVATKIRNGDSAPQSLGVWRLRASVNWYVVTFAIVAGISFYFQLLYAWAHAQSLPQAGGIAQSWIDRLTGLIEARVIIAPLALPLVATLYTIGGFGKGGERTIRRNAAQPIAQPLRNAPQPIAIERETLPQLPTPQPTEIRDNDGRLHGYVCPGCGKSLSISGWSRHKKVCESIRQLHEVEVE